MTPGAPGGRIPWVSDGGSHAQFPHGAERLERVAQHLTIDPRGGLWTGRNWNPAPASATGHNGTAGEGPFVIEMVGDFDAGQDPFDGEQQTAAIAWSRTSPLSASSSGPGDHH